MSDENIKQLEQQVDWLINAYKEEKAIVDGIWKILGNPSYQELKGRSIFDLVRELKAKPENTSTIRARVYKVKGGALAYLVTSDEGEIILPHPPGRYEWMTDEFDLHVYDTTHKDEEHPLCREHAQLGVGA